jgi:hypothetical protein
MTGAHAKDPIQEAEKAVAEVCDRITKTIKEHFGLELSKELVEEMPKRYKPGFVAAHEIDIDFWDKHGAKVLVMARHAAALACFLVTRKQSFMTGYSKEAGRVDIGEWLMAMGIVRSACLVEEEDKARGLPCNRKNFPIEAGIKARVVSEFAEIVAALMTDDAARR